MAFFTIIDKIAIMTQCQKGQKQILSLHGKGVFFHGSITIRNLIRRIITMLKKTVLQYSNTVRPMHNSDYAYPFFYQRTMWIMRSNASVSCYI